MRPGIILASYPVSDYAIDLGVTLIGLYEKHFSDAVLYVGINDAPLASEWISILKNASLEIYYAETPTNLIIRSDASAYQTALKLFRDKNIEHSILWFNHFKSVTHHSTRQLTNTLINDIIERDKIEDIFKNPEIGLYAYDGWSFNHTKMDQGNNEDFTSRYMNFKYPILKITPLYSFCVAKYDPVRYFVDNCNKEFFEEPIASHYFFENDFCQLIFRQGYVPHIHRGFTPEIEATIKQWKELNERT